MNASLPQSRRSLPVWLSLVVWLAAFLSPSACFLQLLLANKLPIPNLLAKLLLLLVFLIPVVALVTCESVAWSCSRTVGRKIGWMLFTLLAMLLQFGIILVVLRAILLTTIGYAQ